MANVLIVKPYLGKEKDFIGLKEYGFSAFPGTKTYLEVPIVGGKFLTGFDENAFYLDRLDEKAKEKEVNSIKKKVNNFKLKYPHYRLDNVIAPKDSNDKLADINNFYLEMILTLNSDTTIFNADDPEDYVKIEIIKTNAKYNKHFCIAPDLETAHSSNKDYKYYISNAERDVELEVSTKKELNKAVTTLDTISSTDREKFILVLKYLLPANKGYNSESENRLYKRADDYINGIVDNEKVKGGENNYKNFVKACSLPKEELLTKVIIKYAVLTNVIRLNTKSKEYEYTKTLQELGKTPELIYDYLTNAKNMELLKEIKESTEEEIRII